MATPMQYCPGIKNKNIVIQEHWPPKETAGIVLKYVRLQCDLLIHTPEVDAIDAG